MSDNLPGMMPTDAPTQSNLPEQPNDPYSNPVISGNSAAPVQPAAIPVEPAAPVTPTPTETPATSTISSGSSNGNFMDTMASESTPPKKSFKMLLMIIIGFVLLLMFLAIGGFASAAYEYIPVPAQIRDLAASVVSKVPFLPQTPRMIVYSMKNAPEYERVKLDSSLAFQLNSPELKEMLGTDVIDFKAVGQSIREGEITQASFNFDLSEFANLDYVSVDGENNFFKINELMTPDKISTMFPSSWGANNPIFNQWVQIPKEKLKSEAATNLDVQGTDEDFENFKADMQQILVDDVVPNLTVKKEDLNGKATYKLSYAPSNTQTSELLDKITDSYYENALKIPRDSTTSTDVLVVKDLTLDLWVDVETKQIRKISNAATLVSDPSALDYSKVLGATTIQNRERAIQAPTDNEIRVSFVLSIDDLPNDVVITAPTDYIDYESYQEQVTRYFSQLMMSQTTEMLGEFSGFSDDSIEGFGESMDMMAEPYSTEDANLFGIQ